LFDSIPLVNLDQSNYSRLRSLRTSFDTFTFDQIVEQLDTMDDVFSSVVEHAEEEVSSCDHGDSLIISPATVPLDFTELHRLPPGTFIGKFMYGTPSFNNIFLPALLYAISFGQVPSAVSAPIEYLTTQNYLASRRLHFCLTGEWIALPSTKLRNAVQNKIKMFCNKGPLELVYDHSTVNLDPDRTRSQFRNYLQRTTDQNELLSIFNATETLF